MGQERTPKQQRRQPAQHGDAHANDGQGQGSQGLQAARRGHSLSCGQQAACGHREQTADEATARGVVPA